MYGISIDTTTVRRSSEIQMSNKYRKEIKSNLREKYVNIISPTHKKLTESKEETLHTNTASLDM